MKIRVKLNSEKKTLKNVDLETGTGQATVIKHPANGVYTFQLIDLATNLGPQKIIAKRVGNNLEIAFDDSKTTDLIIENYYREGLEESTIIGLAEDGQYYAYIPENGLASDAIPVLKENVLATEVLGGEGFVAAAIPFVLGWPWVAGGLGLLGAVAVLAGGGSGGGSGGSAGSASASGSSTPSIANIPLTAGTTAENNRGGFKLDWPAGAEKVEVTFYPEGSHKPLTVTLTKDADGNIISSHPNFIPGVGKDQPIIIPPNSLKDNSPVDVKAFNGNGNVIAQGSDTSAYDADSAPAKVKEAIEQDTDGDGNPNRVKLDLTGPADAPFKVVDKDGKVIAEGTFDKNGEASILAPLDPKNPNRDSKDDLKVITQENGTNLTETALVPAEMVPAPELKPSANPTDPEKSFEVDVKLDNKENTKEIKLDVVDPATGKVTNTITLTKDEKGEFKGPEGVKVENTEEGVKVTLPKDKVPEGSQITASTTNNAGDTSAPSNPVENKQGEEGLAPVNPETLQPSAKPIIESIKAVDSSSPADNNPDEFIVSGTGPANTSITIYGHKGDEKFPIGSATTDKNGNFTVTVTDQGKGVKGVDLVSGDNISVVAHEAGKQPTSSDNKLIPEVADRTPNNTFVPAPELKPSEKPEVPEDKVAVDVKLDNKENAKEIDLTIKKPDGTTETIKLTKDNQDKFVPPAGSDDITVEETENGVTVTLPKDKVPENSQITASTTNNASDKSAPSNPLENKAGEESLAPVEPETLQPSAKPVVESVKAIDTSSPADNNPEEFIVSGTGPKNTSITIYGHKGDEKFPIGSATTDENGNFTATVTDQGKGVDLVSGDKISAVAHETGKQPTPSDEAKEIPAVPAGKEGHIVDTVKPDVKIDIVTHNEPGSKDGSANVNTSGMREGDKLVIGITTEEGEDKTLEFTMGDNGTLQPSPNNDPALKDKVKVNGGNVSIDEDALKDGESISAKVVDIADNETTTEPKTAGFDDASEKPTVESIKAIDTDSPANTTPEKIEAKVTGVKEGDTVIFRDENGDKIAEVEVTPEMKQEDGSFVVPATLKDDQKDTTKVTVTVKSDDKGESAPVTVDVPPVPNGKEGHPNDSVEPKSPEVSATEDKVNVKFDPENTDTLTIKVQPKDEQGNPTGEPETIVYTKQPDGSFTPDEEHKDFPSVNPGENTVEIPRDKLPKNDLDINATAGDIAGNSSTSQTTPVEDTKEKSATPTVESVKAIDTNEVADKTYERTEIKGTGVKGAEVIATVTDKDGNVVEIGRATVGEDGNFTIRGDVPAGVDITDTKNIKVTAEEPNKRISDPVNKDQIPEAEITHPNDLEGPLKPITLPLLPEDNAKISDQKVQLPPETETATVEYIDNEGNPKTANITKDAEGNFVSDDPAVSVGKDDIIFIKGDATKDNTPIKVTATDLAGNPSEPLVTSSGSEVPVVVDESQPGQPEVPFPPSVEEKDNAENPAVKDVVVHFPEDAKDGDKVNVTYTPAPTAENPDPKPVVETFTKTPDGWKKPDGSTLPDVNGNTLTIPGDKVKDGTSVIVNAENAEGTGRTEDAILDKTTPDGDGKPVEKLATPTDLKLEAVDNRQGGTADERKEANPDSFTLTGKVPNAPEGTEVIIKNGDEVVGKGTTDKDGNFSIDFTDEGKKEDITKDTKLSVTAQKPGQPETASETPADITVKPEDIVRADQTPPTVDITPTENGATVTPDKTNPLNEGDKVTITVTPPATPDTPNPNPTTHTYTADANGQLQPDNPASPPVKNDGSIDVPAEPGSTVAVTTEDTAGNSTGKTDGENGAGENPNSVVVPPKAVVPTEKTATPEDVTVKTVEDSNNPADGNPDKFTVTGKVPGATVGTDVEVLDKAGNVLGKGKTTDAEGNFEILASESPNKDLAKDDALVVKATDTAAKKAPSEPAEAPIGDVNKYADTQAPETPHLTPSTTDGSVVLTLPKDANPTDTVVVELTPTGAKDPVKVTLEKNPNGSWTSSHPDLVPNAIDDQESVTIPEGVIADGSKVKAHATDIAGNNSDAKAFDEVTVGEDTRTTKAPEVTIDAVDTDNKADKQADVAIVKGKTDPNAEVTIKDGDKELGTVTADAEGNFTAIIAKPNAANLDGDKGVKAQNPGAEVIDSPNGVDAKELTFSAVAPNKKPSAEIPATVPAIEAKLEDHPYDESDPVAPTLEAVATGDKSGSVNVNFPANNDSVPGDKVTIKFTPEDKPAAADGEQPTPAETVSVTYEKQDDGSWKPVAEHAEKAKENKLPESVKAADDTTKPSLTIPADSLKDGSDVTALATDNAGKTANGQAVNAQGKPLKEDGTPVADGEKPAEKVVAPDDKTATPVVTKVEGLNADFEPKSLAPTAVRITGTVENGVTKDKIKIYDKDGQPITIADDKLGIEVTETKKDGVTTTNFVITIDDINAVKDKGPLQITAQAGEKPESERSEPQAVPTTVERGTPTEAALAADAAAKATDKGGFINDDTPPAKPTLAKGTGDADGEMSIELPADAKLGTRLIASYTDEKTGEAKTIYVEKGEKVWSAVDAKGKAATLPENVEIKANENKLVIGEDAVKDKSEVKARFQDLAGNLSENNKETTNFDEQTAQPTLTVQSIDTAEKADNTIDAIVLSGTVTNEAGAKVTFFTTAKDAAQGTDPTALANVSATVGTDGNYKVVLVKTGTSAEDKGKLKTKLGLTDDAQIVEVAELPEVGTKFTAKAQQHNAEGQPTEVLSAASTEAPLAALGNNTESHPFDKAAPAAATISAPNEENNVDDKGDAIITLPTDVVAGDKLTINYTPQVKGQGDQPEKEVVYTFDGTNWTPTSVGGTETTTPPAGFTIANGKLRIDAPHIADNSKVKTKVTDLAGKDSGEPSTANQTEATVGTDPKFTHKPVEVTSYTTDTSTDADKTPETWVIEGKAPAGSTVYLKDKAGNIIAKHTVTDGTSDTDTTQFGTFKFTVTKGETASAIGETATANATVTDLDAIKEAANNFTVSAKKNGEAEGVADNKVAPTDVAEGTNISKIAGTNIKAESALFNGDNQPETQDSDYVAGTESITVDKTAEAAAKITEKPEDYFLVAKEKAGSAERPFVDGDFTYTSARQVGGKEVHADKTAPNATITVLEEVSGNIAKRKDVTKGSANTADTVADAKNAETNENFGFKVTTDKTVEGDTITVVRYKAGSGVNAGNADYNEKAVYKFTNGAWTLVEDAEKLSADEIANGANVPASVATVGATPEKPTTFTFTPNPNLVKAGDLFVVTYKDYAGNAKQAMRTVKPEMLFDATPETADVPDVFVGTISRAGSKETALNGSDNTPIKPNKDKFLLNGAGDEGNGINSVNSGDIVFRPGKDNRKMEIRYIASDASADADDPTTTIYAQHQPAVEGGKSNTATNIFKFYKDDKYATEVEADTIRQVVGEDGTYYYVLNAAKVKDATTVSVVGIDGEGNNSYEKPTLAKDGTKKDAEVLAGFDDKTDSAVGKPEVSQTDENADIAIKPTPAADTDGNAFNNDDNADAVAYVVTFDATHLSKDITKTYGLNAVHNPGTPGQKIPEDHGNPQGVNYIVVSRDAEGKWSATLVKGEGAADDGMADKLLVDALSGALSGNSAANNTGIPADIGTLDSNGVLTLSKNFVKGQTDVKVKAIDTYGNDASADAFTAKHTVPAEPVVITDQPTITDIGFGNAYVEFGGNNDTVVIEKFFDGEDVIEVTRNSRETSDAPIENVENAPRTPEYSISVGGQTLDTAALAEKGIVFDEDTGRVTLKTPTDDNDITATGYRQNVASKTVEGRLDKQSDPTPNSVDEIEDVTVLTNGGISFKPGADNTKVTVEYTRQQDGVTEKVTLTKQDNGSWSADKHGTDFDFTNSDKSGVITLKAEAVKDMHNVTVWGTNKKGADALDALANEDITLANLKAELLKARKDKDDNKPETVEKLEKLEKISSLINSEKEALSGKDDATDDRAEAPTVPDINASPATKADLPTVAPGQDNNRVEIKFTPKADSPTEKTISAVLKQGGWDLVDDQGNPVNDDMASIDPATGVVTINTPLQGNTSVKAKGTDPYSNQSTETAKTVPQDGTAGNPENAGGNTESKPVAPADGDHKPIGDGSTYPGFTQPKGRDDVAYLDKAAGDGTQIIYFNIYDVESGSEKGMAVNLNNKTFAISDTTITSHQPTAGAFTNFTSIANSHGFISDAGGDNLNVTSNGKYRLIADSPLDSEDGRLIGATPGSLLTVATHHSQLGWAPLYASDKGYAQNVKAYSAGKAKSEPFELEAPKNGDNQGAVIIKPKGQTDYTNPVTLSVKYIDESGNPQTATLKQTTKGGAWAVTSGNPDAFTLNGTDDPILKADFLEDKHANGVSVRVLEEGKSYSSWTSETPWLDPEPVEPPVPNNDMPTTGGELNGPNLDTTNPKNTFGTDDILTRVWPRRLDTSNGLEKTAENKRGLTITTDRETNKTTVTVNDEVEHNNILLVNGSLGDTAPSVFKFRRQDIEINMKDGNDVLAVRNSLGDYKGNNVINLGDGSDLLTVGTAGRYFKLSEKTDETNPAKRFYFEGTGGTELNALENSEGYEHGGTILNTVVNGGAGHDVVAVEGDVRGDDPAIGHGAVLKLGEGNDAVIIAPNYANSTSQRGEVGAGAVIDFGTGNDYLNAVGIRGGAKVDMGDGKDEVVVDRILSGNTVLNMGGGDDTVRIGGSDRSGEARDGAQINLGEGNDTLHFKAASNLWGDSTNKEARFMAKLDGGAGYDTFVLETPDQNNIGSVFKHNITHLSTKYIKNIEEVKMSAGTAFDISIGDLWQQAPGVLRINALGPQGDQLRPTAAGKNIKMNRLVDLGETNSNTGSETYQPAPGISDKFNGYDRVGSAQGFWKKVDGVTHTEKATNLATGQEQDVIYDVYRFGGDSRYEVWIQQGIEVI
ncbi:hypothetical protein JFL47_00510 [Haemophilus haemoglobinophilus]|nr:hypothetical protein [Canicola haemoglobinophilus]